MNRQIKVTCISLVVPMVQRLCNTMVVISKSGNEKRKKYIQSHSLNKNVHARNISHLFLWLTVGLLSSYASFPLSTACQRIQIPTRNHSLWCKWETNLSPWRKVNPRTSFLYCISPWIACSLDSLPSNWLSFCIFLLKFGSSLWYFWKFSSCR